MARSLKYPSHCLYCGKFCDPEKEKKETQTRLSFLHRVKGKWYAHCRDCYEKKKQGEGK